MRSIPTANIRYAFIQQQIYYNVKICGKRYVLLFSAFLFFFFSLVLLFGNLDTICFMWLMIHPDRPDHLGIFPRFSLRI